MPIPWLAALKFIPWGTILENTPALARSADRLLSGTRAPHIPVASADDLRDVLDRVETLERRDRETAELLAQITTQMSALAAATEVLEARARWLLTLSLGLTAIMVVVVVMVVVLLVR
jgi:hypothetical protein